MLTTIDDNNDFGRPGRQVFGFPYQHMIWANLAKFKNAVVNVHS